MAPDSMKDSCSKTIVKAHTVAKSGSLKKISRGGHVYSIVPSIENLIRNKGRIKPQLVGINKASTFTGFCSVHDNSIFSKIEDHPFEASQEQCFLLAYRALAREMFTKKALVASSRLRKEADRGKSIEQLGIQMKSNFVDIGASQGLRDIEYYKSAFDKILLSKDFGDIRAFIIDLESPPPIMCSTGIFPEQDFAGKQLQDLTDLAIRPLVINFTSFYGGKFGEIVFTWLSECDPVCRPFIDSLKALADDRMTDGLIRFFFEFSENLHIQPEWWDNLEVNQRDALTLRMSESADLSKARNPDCIAEDGIRYDKWTTPCSSSVGF